MDEAKEAPRRRMSRRGTLLGSLIAIIAVAGLAWLAWDLTHQPSAAATAGGPGTSARGRGGPGAGPPPTVGVARAERADIPVVLEALGTVTPAATAIVRPQVTGVLQQVLY